MKFLKALLIFIAIVIIGSCSVENKIEVGNVNNFTLKKFENKVLYCQADIDVENKNNFSINLSAENLNVYAKDKVFGSVKFETPLIIEKNTKKNYTLNFSVEINDDGAGLTSVVSKLLGQKIQYTIKGKIVAHYFLFQKSFEVNQSLGKW